MQLVVTSVEGHGIVSSVHICLRTMSDALQVAAAVLPNKPAWQLRFAGKALTSPDE